MTFFGNSDLPKLIANKELRAFRAQGNLSWRDFNALWRHICNFINAPPNNILLDTSSAGETEYKSKIIDIMRDVSEAGLFAQKTRGSWRFGSAGGQEGHVAIYRYIEALVAYAAEEVMKQIPEGGFSQSIETNNVSGWLMNEDPDESGHVATLLVPATDAASTVVASSQTSVCSTGTIVSETVCGAAENLIGGEQVTGM